MREFGLMVQFAVMRSPYLPIILTVFFFSQNVFTVSAAFPDCAINTLLKIGSKGPEVQCLQQKIGVTTDGVFGPMTNAAVMVFQSHNGLIADGIVGPLSRAVLNVPTTTDSAYPAGCTGTEGYSPTTGVKCDSNLSDARGSVGSGNNNSGSSPENTTNSTNTNPNLVNLDPFIKTVVDVNRKNGTSEEKLRLIADTLGQTVRNSNINYNEEFKKLLINDSKLSADLGTHLPLAIFDKVISKTLSFLGIKPSVAYAGAGIPFGGALIFPFFCGYSASWMITIQPLPPTYVALLSYIPGTQGFASYNIPFTSYLLGTYVTPGVCIIPAGPAPIVITTEGTITPMVGSSPL